MKTDDIFLREDQSSALEALVAVYEFFLDASQKKDAEEARVKAAAAARQRILGDVPLRGSELAAMAKSFGKRYENLPVSMIGLTGAQGSGKSTLLASLKDAIKPMGGEILLFSQLKSVTEQSAARGMRSLSYQAFSSAVKKVMGDDATVGALAEKGEELSEAQRKKLMVALGLPENFFADHRVLMCLDEAHDWSDTGSATLKVISLVFKPAIYLVITATPRFPSVIPYISIGGESTVATPLVSSLFSQSLFQLPEAIKRLIDDSRTDKLFEWQSGPSKKVPGLLFFREVGAAALTSLSGSLSGHFETHLGTSYGPGVFGKEMIQKPFLKLKDIASRVPQDPKETTDWYFEELSNRKTLIEREVFCLFQGKTFHRPHRKFIMGVLTSFFADLWSLRFKGNVCDELVKAALFRFQMEAGFSRSVFREMDALSKVITFLTTNDERLSKVLSRYEPFFLWPFGGTKAPSDKLIGEMTQSLAATAHNPFSPLFSLSPEMARKRIGDVPRVGKTDYLISSVLALGTGFDAIELGLVALAQSPRLPSLGNDWSEMDIGDDGEVLTPPLISQKLGRAQRRVAGAKDVYSAVEVTYGDGLFSDPWRNTFSGYFSQIGPGIPASVKIAGGAGSPFVEAPEMVGLKDGYGCHFPDDEEISGKGLVGDFRFLRTPCKRRDL